MTLAPPWENPRPRVESPQNRAGIALLFFEKIEIFVN
jgi:hypothetical protein